MKILILTQERSGGTSLTQILSNILKVNEIDDPYTYISRGFSQYYESLTQYNNVQHNDINYNKFLNDIFGCGFNIIKLSITYLSIEQIEEIKDFIRKEDVFTISLINTDIFRLTKSYCSACISGNFDITTHKTDIYIDETFFTEKYNKFYEYYKILEDLSSITSYKICFNTFYDNIDNLKNLLCALNITNHEFDTVTNNLFNKCYNTNLINIQNIDRLKKITIDII